MGEVRSEARHGAVSTAPGNGVAAGGRNALAVMPATATATATAAAAPAMATATAPAKAKATVCGDATWTSVRQGKFFDQLALTGQVAEAAAAAGVTTQDAYSKLRRHARFGERWRRAMDVGYDRLEAALLRQAMGEPGVKVDVPTALLLLERRRGGAQPAAASQVRGAVDSGRGRAERELLRRLKALAKNAAATERA